MARQSLVVIDDFYADPYAVRELALSAEFTRYTGVTYPGGEARVMEVDWEIVRQRLADYLHSPLSTCCPKDPPFPQGLFRLALKSDEATRPDGIHQDRQSWSGVIYLSLPEHCMGGVGFYRHRETGALAITAEWEEQVFPELVHTPSNIVIAHVRSYFRDMSHWEEIERVAMRFNRAVLLNAQRFHASLGLFGDCPKNGRLSQHFEFYCDGD